MGARGQFLGRVYILSIFYLDEALWVCVRTPIRGAPAPYLDEALRACVDKEREKEKERERSLHQNQNQKLYGRARILFRRSTMGVRGQLLGRGCIFSRRSIMGVCVRAPVGAYPHLISTMHYGRAWVFFFLARARFLL